jgi:hypothetical protein
MYLAQGLDLDHPVALALGGRPDGQLAHRSCNRRAGALLKQALSALRGTPGGRG